MSWSTSTDGSCIGSAIMREEMTPVRPDGCASLQRGPVAQRADAGAAHHGVGVGQGADSITRLRLRSQQTWSDIQAGVCTCRCGASAKRGDEFDFEVVGVFEVGGMLLGAAGMGMAVGEEEGTAVVLGLGGEEVDVEGGVDVEEEVVETGGEAVVPWLGEGGGLFQALGGADTVETRSGADGRQLSACSRGNSDVGPPCRRPRSNAALHAGWHPARAMSIRTHVQAQAVQAPCRI